MITASTDQLDEHIARSRSLVADFGELVDPIADKALTLGAFVMLAVVGLLSWWVTTLIAFRELGVTWLHAVLLKRGVVVTVDKSGKLKTVLQMLAIWVSLILWTTIELGGEWNGLFAQGMLVFGWTVTGLALVVTLWSGQVHVVEGMRLEKDTKIQS